MTLLVNEGMRGRRHGLSVARTGCGLRLCGVSHMGVGCILYERLVALDWVWSLCGGRA